MSCQKSYPEIANEDPNPRPGREETEALRRWVSFRTRDWKAGKWMDQGTNSCRGETSIWSRGPERGLSVVILNSENMWDSEGIFLWLQNCHGFSRMAFCCHSGM